MRGAPLRLGVGVGKGGGGDGWWGLVHLKQRRNAKNSPMLYARYTGTSTQPLPG